MGTDQTIKTGHLASGDLWAGAEVQVYNMLSALKVYPSLQLMAVLLNEGILAKKLRQLDIAVTILDENKYGFSGLARQLTGILEKEKVDILHTHRYKENVLGAMMKKQGVAPRLVQTVHGLPEPFSGLRRLKAEFYGYLNRRQTRRYFDRVQTVSRQIEETVARYYDRRRIAVIPNSIRLADIKTTISSGEMRERLGLKEGEPVLGTVGRLVPVKGIDLFLEAARIIIEKIPRVKFIIVGDGPLGDDLHRLAQKLDIADSVIWTGFCERPLDIMQLFDLFVLTSHNEGIPTVLLEAMALGIPAAATAVGGVPEVIVPGITGELVPAGNSGAMAETCLTLLESGEQLSALGKAARKRVEENFTNEIQGKSVLRIYQQLMGTE